MCVPVPAEPVQQRTFFPHLDDSYIKCFYSRQTSESPPAVPEEPKPKQEPKAEVVEAQPEWIPGGEDTIATETPMEPVVKEETARSPLKRYVEQGEQKQIDEGNFTCLHNNAMII